MNIFVPSYLFNFDIIFKTMKEEQSEEKGRRKSNRQRIPNNFYTEGINQLKKNKNFREPPMPKTANKKSKIYQEEQEFSYLDQKLEVQERPRKRRQEQYFPARLPTSKKLINVQFVFGEQAPQKQDKIDKKKIQAPLKSSKKQSSSKDLLSLFQQAIENVNEEPKQTKKYYENPQAPEYKPKYQPMIYKKKVRTEDEDGKIIGVLKDADKVTFNHTKLGNYEVPFERSPIKELIEEKMIDEFDEELKTKILDSKLVGSISIFM